MSIQRSLRLAGYVLVALTILCLFLLPEGSVPTVATSVVVGLTVLDLLALTILTLLRDRSVRGLVQSLVALGLILMLGGGWCGEVFANTVYLELANGESAELEGRGMAGYSLTMEKREDAEHITVALTQPDHVTIHETVSSTAPMRHDGIAVHPLSVEDDRAVLLARTDLFRPFVGVGVVLFVIGLGLSVVPSVRKRGED